MELPFSRLSWLQPYCSYFGSFKCLSIFIHLCLGSLSLSLLMIASFLERYLIFPISEKVPSQLKHPSPLQHSYLQYSVNFASSLELTTNVNLFIYFTSFFGGKVPVSCTRMLALSGQEYCFCFTQTLPGRILSIFSN